MTNVAVLAKDVSSLTFTLSKDGDVLLFLEAD